MMNIDVQCEHTCNGLCNALEILCEREQETLALVHGYRNECSYEDVRILLDELVTTHARSKQLLEETRTMMQAKCEVIEQMRIGFGG